MLHTQLLQSSDQQPRALTAGVSWRIPVLTFKLILTDTLCSGIESTFLCCANAQYQRPPAAILRRKLVTIGSGHESNHRSLEYIGTTKGYQALFWRFNGPGSITKLPCHPGSCIGDHPYKLTIQSVLQDPVPGTRGVRYLFG